MFIFLSNSKFQMLEEMLLRHVLLVLLKFVTVAS